MSVQPVAEYWGDRAAHSFWAHITPLQSPQSFHAGPTGDDWKRHKLELHDEKYASGARECHNRLVMDKSEPTLTTEPSKLKGPDNSCEDIVLFTRTGDWDMQCSLEGNKGGAGSKVPLQFTVIQYSKPSLFRLQLIRIKVWKNVVHSWVHTLTDTWHLGRLMSHLSVLTKLDSFFKPASLRSETSITSESSVDEQIHWFL
jgi:hypothetical protein